MMSFPPIEDMLLFVDVVKTKSFTKAAFKHALTAAAVSKRISSLENQLGIRLLNRTTRKLATTESGKLLFQHCVKIYNDVDEAFSAALDLHEKPRGTLTISSPTNFSNLVLSPIVSEFSQKFPEIKLKIELKDAKDLPQVGDFNIAIRSGQLRDSSLIARKLLTVTFVYCGSPQYFHRNTPPKEINELYQHNLIDYNYREDENCWSFFQDTNQRTLEINPKIISNNALFVKHLAINGGGIACLPSFMVSNELKSGSLVACLTDYKTLSQPVWLIHPYTDRYLPKKVRLFIDFIFSKMQTYPA